MHCSSLSGVWVDRVTGTVIAVEEKKAVSVSGSEWDQDRGGRGFIREAGEEEEGYSFRRKRDWRDGA